MTNNENDISLLYEKPTDLIKKYQKTIEIIVKKSIKKGLFRAEDIDEIIQTINEKLLVERIKRMQFQYNHASSFATYFSKVVQNLCLEIYRKNKQFKNNTENDADDQPVSDEEWDYLTNLFIQDELKRLESIFKLYCKSRPKVELCLKLIFRLDVTTEDILKYCPECPDCNITEILSKLNNNELTDNEIYEIVTPIFNKCEKKNNSVDAIRKWTSLKREEIITILNSDASAKYDKETLEILLSKYYERQH